MKIIIKLSILLSFFFTLGCKGDVNSLKNIENRDSIILVSDTEPIKSIINKGNYPFVNIKDVSLGAFHKEKDSGKYKFQELSKIEKNKWLGQISYLKNQNGNYEALKFSFQQFSKVFNSIIVYAQTDGYEALLLINIDLDGTLINVLELSGGYCQGAVENEETGKVQWCDIRVSNISYPYIKITTTTSVSDSFMENAETVNTILVEDYVINDIGTIETK